MSLDKKSRNERLRFITKWADYVRVHPDKEWGSQQKILIDSQLKGAKKQFLSLKEYLEIKEQLLKSVKV